MITIALISDDADTKTFADNAPADTKVITESAITSDMAAADRSSWLASLPVDVVAFGPDIESRVVLESSNFLRTSRPEVDCIAICEPSTEFLAAAMTHGLRDIVAPSEDHSELADAIGLLEEASAVRLNARTGPGPELGSVVTVLGPKGGVGKTTLAVNLAYAMAAQAPGEVVLIDLDLAGGDVNDSLGAEVNSNVATVVGSGVVDDPTSLKLSLSSHSSGLLLLPAPTSLVEAAAVDGDGVQVLLDQLSRLFRTVIVDTGPGTSDPTVAAVRSANEVIAVMTPEVGGVRTMERHLDGYDSVGLQRARRHIVMNKEDRRSGLTREDVESVLRRRVDVSIPYDRNITAAGNSGVPYLESRPRSGVANAVAALTAAMQGAGAPAQGSARGWFR